MTGTIHINRGVNRQYWVRVRERGCRKFHLIGKPVRSKDVAFLRLARLMAASSLYGRGEVLFTSDCYDPSLVISMVRP